MKDLTFWLSLAGGEVALLLFVLLLVYWIRHMAQDRRDRQAVERLVKAVRAGRADREAAIVAFLSERMGLEGVALERARVAMMREELGLLQRFATLYRDRDASSAAQFHIALESALAPWFDLRGSGKGDEVEGPGDGGELEALRQENQRLSEELSVTMETMSRMLAEYSSMFAGPEAGVVADAGQPSTDAGTVDADTAAEDAELPARPAPGLDAEALDIGDADEVVAEASMPVQESEEEAVVEPEAIDDLLADEPLAQDLGGLFDEDELASLDEAATDSVTADTRSEPEKAIVI